MMSDGCKKIAPDRGIGYVLERLAFLISGRINMGATSFLFPVFLRGQREPLSAAFAGMRRGKGAAQQTCETRAAENGSH